MFHIFFCLKNCRPGPKKIIVASRVPQKKQLPSFLRIVDLGSKRNMNLPAKNLFVMDETGI